MASRMRMLTVGVDTGRWGVAKQFLGYENGRTPLVQPRMLDVALKLTKRAEKREMISPRLGSRARCLPVQGARDSAWGPPPATGF